MTTRLGRKGFPCPVSGTKWTEAEEQHLASVEAIDDYALSVELGRSPRAVQERRHKLKVLMHSGRPWSVEEIETLRACKSYDDARAKLGRARGSIQRKCASLGIVLAARVHVPWSVEDVATLRTCSTYLEAQAALPHRTREQMRNACFRYGHRLRWPKWRRANILIEWPPRTKERDDAKRTASTELGQR